MPAAVAKRPEEGLIHSRQQIGTRRNPRGVVERIWLAFEPRSIKDFHVTRFDFVGDFVEA